MCLDDEERPKTEEVNYLVEAATKAVAVSGNVETAGETPTEKGDDISIIFCIDISSSMMTNSKGNHLKRMIIDQIGEMVKSNDKCKVGIVTFSNEVFVIGDGSNPFPGHVAVDKCMDFDTAVRIGKEVAKTRLTKNIGEMNKFLVQ